jgi:hypothetical protein
MKKYGTQLKKVFGSSDLLRKGHAFPGQALTVPDTSISVPNLFSQNMGFMGIKRRRIKRTVDLKNMNLP